VHPTFAASERNWSLWGWVYAAAHNKLGLERAITLITFCFNDRARLADQHDFDLLLSTIENDEDVESEHDRAETDAPTAGPPEGAQGAVELDLSE
jgi:hypothetical protein